MTIAFLSRQDILLPTMATETRTKLIAVVDDDELLRDALRRLLKRSGFDVTSFGSAEDFLKSDQLSKITCLIADIVRTKYKFSDTFPLLSQNQGIS